MSQTIDVDVTPTITAGAYTDLDIVGGLQTLTGLGGAGGVLHTVQVYDDAAVDAAFLIHIFREAPTGTYTDNALLTLDAADKDRLIGTIEVASGDYKAIGGDSNATLNNLGFSFGPTPGFDHLYAIAVLNGSAPTYAATSDLRFRYSVLPG